MIVTDQGQRWMEAVVVGAERQEPLVLRLYVNDYRPHRGSLVSDFREASGHGYRSRRLDGGWRFTDDGHPYRPRETFEFVGEMDSVYGAYVTTADSETLVAVVRFRHAPYVFTNAGGKIIVPMAVRWGQQ